MSPLSQFPQAGVPWVGVSACLLGHQVRYDGTDRGQQWLTQHLAQAIHLVAVCPEVEAGLGVPRERINLVQLGEGQVRVLGAESGRDRTQQLQGFAARWVQDCPPGLCGMVLKSRSPSCGTGTARLLGPQGEELGRTWGVFAQGVHRRWPWLPLIEEVELEEPRRCSAFLVRVFLLCRWHQAQGAGQLAQFAQREQLLLAALCPHQIPKLDGLATEPRDEKRVSDWEHLIHQAVSSSDSVENHLRAWQWWLAQKRNPTQKSSKWLEQIRRWLSGAASPWLAASQVWEAVALEAHLPQQSYAQPWPSEVKLLLPGGLS